VKLRLRQLKISGFKSFADTTLIEFPGSLAGIVGPNGCGKSNVIDAIRWVLGEGRISELRGSSSMSELIFSGSANRPASSRASVEMVLDNSDNSILGPWGAYAELSIKRVVTRDGSNAYLINNQQVRRRDVQDIFMGTGLGPRSYAIISQGMISNFIKAKPEELRIYLEEAAGVSKYKERRKETESALNSTRDNLQKVAYLQETKRAEIERLTREAETAKRWSELEDERKQSELLFQFMQERESAEAVDRLNARIAKKETEMISAQGEVQRLVLEIEQLREHVNEKRAQTDVARQAKFEAEKSVSEVQGNIRHIIERKDLANHQIETDNTMLESRAAALSAAEERERSLTEESQRLTEEASNFEAEAEGLSEQVDAAQQRYEDTRRGYEAARQSVNEAQSRIGIVNVEMQAFEREIVDVENRLEGLQTQAASSERPDEAHYEALVAQIDELSAQFKQAHGEVEQGTDRRTQAEQRLAQLRDEKSRNAAELARIEARMQTLQGIQEKFEQEGKLRGWLEKMGFSGAKRLFERIEVDPDWARAIEAVLTVRTSALSIGNLDSTAGFTLAAPPARLVFYGAAGECAAQTAPEGLRPLAGFVHCVDAMTERALARWLSGVYTAPNLEEAIRLRSHLSDSERIVTPEGHIVDVVSVSFWAEENESAGLISRAAEIKKLKADETELAAQLESVEERERVAKTELEELDAMVKTQNAQAEQLRSRLHELQVEQTRLAAQIEAWKEKNRKIAEDIELLKARLVETTAKRDEVEGRFETLDRELGLKQQAVTDAQLVLEEAEGAVSEAEEALTEKRQAAKLSRMQASSNLERASDARREAETSRNEIERLNAEIESLKEELAGLDVEAQKEGLVALTQRLEGARVALLDAEQAMANAENAVEEARSRHGELLDNQAPLLQEISELKVKRQACLTQGEVFTARLEELQADREALAARVLEGQFKTSVLKAKVTELSEKIAALGPVNHAALENLEASEAAMKETERQVADLEEAIANLEATIHKIDAETRELLSNTFETVNRNFGEMFTGLFGGGSAELRMTGEEILDTGIEVIAQPPGKKNTNVKVLSGGEQALTATALVFAIFRLNPAPFCLLDEVDAPLDEANQDRLARKIASMSEATQFVMITHHRVTMEQLKQLVGVTMKEPGVSRVVAVDVEQASQMAQS